ncbi:MAG: ATP-dependent DNA ligase [candidate division Zixibacteria bacterium]|nr:ATP-dependent DNA ligase [candidate division Zixibacteria bacterium]NIR64117.1 ATP-dependent DNA ligase [candidate division Zixibacteria bacterium]NIS16913.1 ATP-dependent DNA ligase [candidate division Zixibacteria bacterium]NIS46017.1 ATP-dependent DNA ligase [candidate division Zixibacteria bacterium]NIT52007.1 ATP-dependent DNA ligase [candidate division Zixibacteria bacterium]
MLATLTHDYFSDENWIYERKLDGERCLCFKNGKKVELKSRNKRVLNDTYPELVKELEKQDTGNFIADGEIVAFEGDVTSFSKLQNRMHSSESSGRDVAVYYYLFDLLHVGGYDMTKLELRYRKAILKKALEFSNKLRFTAHRNEEGKKYHQEACKKGWEGVIAKAADSTYAHSRSKNWLKFKCVNQQEFVIGGFTDPQGQRSGFGALLIGYYKDGDFHYAGKVGTGYDDEMLEKLGKKLKDIERKSNPFEEDVKEKGAHWVKPKLVGEVGFTEWTSDGKLRHPRFLGLRRDKKAKNVEREKAK